MHMATSDDQHISRILSLEVGEICFPRSREGFSDFRTGFSFTSHSTAVLRTPRSAAIQDSRGRVSLSSISRIPLLGLLPLRVISHITMLAVPQISTSIESQLVAASRILEVDVELQVIHLPNIFLLSFADPETNTSETYFIKRSDVLPLGI